MTNAVLAETRGLTLWAGERCLVRGLDWRVQRGERWCVIGRNAVGKSTLLRALAGLPVARREGEVAWLGRPQRDWSPADAAAVRAFMPQQASDRFALSVERLLELSVAVPGQRSAARTLSQLDADALAQRSVLELSGGERQRVALAQCALQGAPLLLLDEPVAFQDPAHQQQVAQWLVGEFAADALVVTAHDVNWIARIATHVLALFGDGHWRLGPAAELIEQRTLEGVYGCAWQQAGGAWLAR
ncbi:ABC transporter ATP-binding protein [Caldimonas sp. KR1-144]|uniref:ABC transporter ATP-binding protein n=1 Tax=Caldimonas sp. KR1-144 TaxID=3400911 RepID=UPI003C09126D